MAQTNGIIVERYSSLGDNVNKKTNYKTSEYEATIAGFRAYDGDIQESGSGNIIQVYTYAGGDGYWYIRADFRTHKNSENWYVDVMFSSKGLNDLTVKTNGNVGIGTTNPQDKLDVNGALRFNGDANRRVYGASRSGRNAVVLDGNWDELEVKGRVIDWTGSNLHIGFDNDHSDNLIEMGRNVGYIKFLSGGGTNETMRIAKDGNVGIGTPDPNAKLHVNGDIRIGSISNSDNNTAGYGERLHFSGGGDWGTYDSDNSDSLWIGRYNADNNQSELRVNLGDDNTFNDKFVVGYTKGGDWNPALTVGANGKITAKQITLDIGTFPDYVFANGYNLMSLEEVDAFIQENKHLPNMPSETEVVESGMDVAQINTILVEKVEELTLYTIELKKELERVKQELKTLSDKE